MGIPNIPSATARLFYAYKLFYFLNLPPVEEILIITPFFMSSIPRNVPRISEFYKEQRIKDKIANTQDTNNWNKGEEILKDFEI